MGCQQNLGFARSVEWSRKRQVRVEVDSKTGKGLIAEGMATGIQQFPPIWGKAY